MQMIASASKSTIVIREDARCPFYQHRIFVLAFLPQHHITVLYYLLSAHFFILALSFMPTSPNHKHRYKLISIARIVIFEIFSKYLRWGSCENSFFSFPLRQKAPLNLVSIGPSSKLYLKSHFNSFQSRVQTFFGEKNNR